MNETGLSPRQIKWGLVALLALYVLSVLVHLGLMELEGEEPRRAVVSLEMMHSGNYLNPTLFGWPYYNKPPVYNWILIGFIRLFGNASELVLRLPSLFFYLVWALCHYYFTRAYLSRAVALLSSFFLLTSGDIYFYGLGQGAEIDVFYSFVVYLQVMALFLFFEKGRWLPMFVVSYLLCAVGFLTKGFPSVVFQGFTLVALGIHAHSLRPLFRWQHLAGLLLFAGVVGLYFWGYGQNGDTRSLLVNFLNESLTKSAIGERSHKVFEKSVGYPFLLFKLVAPWTLLLLLLLVRPVRAGLWQQPLLRFSVLFIACNLWIYWLTGQPKARYVYMFAPFAAVLFAVLWQRYAALASLKADRILHWFGLLFALAAAALLAVPFVLEVNTFASITSGVLLGFFAWRYFKLPPRIRIWGFVAGVIALRLVYAVVFIPIQDKGTAYYEAPVQAAAAAFGKGPLWYWAPPETFVVRVATSLFTFDADTLLAPPLMHPQIPYYYYRQTGQLMRYDTSFVPARNQVSFTRHLSGHQIDTTMLFADKRKTEGIVMYRGR